MAGGKGSIPAIEVRGLRKTYTGGIEAVKGLDFDVAPGEVFGLLGPNGADKSTTIGMLTTTITPSGGSARVAGFDVVADPIGARRTSAVVFQEAVVDRSLTGLRNMAIHARLWGERTLHVDCHRHPHGHHRRRRPTDTVPAVAGLSFVVVAAFASAMLAISVRVFTRISVQ